MNEFEEETLTVIAQALVQSQVLCTACNSNWIAVGFHAFFLPEPTYCMLNMLLHGLFIQIICKCLCSRQPH